MIAVWGHMETKEKSRSNSQLAIATGIQLGGRDLSGSVLTPAMVLHGEERTGVSRTTNDTTVL